ncbi:MAG: translesion DNA synthesis-associated protein ImuA [Pseudomonadales bacterium]
MKTELSTLLKRHDIWQAAHSQRQRSAVSTGFEALDNKLHDGGWPVARLTELLVNQHGIGEWQLVMPATIKLCQDGGYCLLIAPPYQPYAPALEAAGIAGHRLIVVEPKDLQQTLWSAEQALASEACSTLLCWLGPQNVKSSQLRKLQLAAQRGNCTAFIYRDTRFAQQHSPASLRIRVKQQGAKLALSIVKQPGGWSGQQVFLPQLQPQLQRQQAVTALPVHSSQHIRQAVHSVYPTNPQAQAKQLAASRVVS